MKRFLIETWGCQMNVHDSEKFAGILGGLGYAPTTEAGEADLILLNTCSVRDKAEQKVFARLGHLRALKRANPELVLGVVGCVAQQEGEAIFRRAPWVDLVMGPRTIAQLPEILERARREGRSISLAREDDPIVSPAPTAARAAGPRAYVTVMEGCNKTCTYCIVPFTRGAEVYRSAEAILAEVAALTAQGYGEIELLGQNVNAWHGDGHDFGSLLRMVDRVPGVRRLRFTTSHPGHLKEGIMDAMRDAPAVCNHLHLPAQSGSDRILERMQRGYTRAKYVAKIAALRARVADIAFSTDFIVGFPGETEADFAATLALLREVEFDQIYAFTFSPRPGTVAASDPEAVPDPVRQERLRTLLAAQEAIQSGRNAALLGRRFEVLIDGPARSHQDQMKGRTTCNRIVHVPADGLRPGVTVTVRITRAHAHSLSGEPVPERGAA